LAIFNQETDEFMTNFFCPEDGEVVGYMSGKRLEELVNQIFRDKDFQVR
jgi:hypothetical protein